MRLIMSIQDQRQWLECVENWYSYRRDVFHGSWRHTVHDTFIHSRRAIYEEFRGCCNTLLIEYMAWAIRTQSCIHTLRDAVRSVCLQLHIDLCSWLYISVLHWMNLGLVVSVLYHTGRGTPQGKINDQPTYQMPIHVTKKAQWEWESPEMVGLMARLKIMESDILVGPVRSTQQWYKVAYH